MSLTKEQDCLKTYNNRMIVGNFAGNQTFKGEVLLKKRILPLILVFALALGHISYVELNLNVFAESINNNYSCDYYELTDPVEISQCISKIFSKYNIDDRLNLLMVGCDKEYILDSSLVGNAIGIVRDLKYGGYDICYQNLEDLQSAKVLLESDPNIEYVEKNEKLKLIDDPIIVYRVYNRYTGEHLFTSKESEYNKLGNLGWIKEDEAFNAYSEDEKPDDAVAVYRLYNPNAKGGDHHYTKSYSEAEKLVGKGWKWDSNAKPLFYAKGETEVYRLYNKTNGRHHYTPKEGEIKNMKKTGWITEGIAWTVNGYYTNDGARISE